MAAKRKTRNVPTRAERTESSRLSSERRGEDGAITCEFKRAKSPHVKRLTSVADRDAKEDEENNSQGNGSDGIEEEEWQMDDDDHHSKGSSGDEQVSLSLSSDEQVGTGAAHEIETTTAYGRAFRKIMRKKASNLSDTLGPVLSSQKQLIAKKLEEAAAERKGKSENKKEKQALKEKGHVVPSIYLGAKDKELMKLATKGVVKLFNAVSKAQSVQGTTRISKDSEAKEVAKRSKSTFLAALQGHVGTDQRNVISQSDGSKGDNHVGNQPGWSVLQDSFMLGKSRLKDWDTKKDFKEECQLDGSTDSDSFSD